MKKIVNIDAGNGADFLLISDIHIDNPKCNESLLKRHLDKAKAMGAKILINGDLFDLMQGKGDKRSSKKDLKPKYLGVNYFDAVVEDAVDFFAPYAQNLAFVGYGNHETSCIRHHEHDPLKSFVTLMRYKHNSPVELGEYSGFINIKLSYKTNGRAQHQFTIFYHHGYGGGGAVTKGVIQNQRVDAQVEGVDCVWMGHVHELYHIVTQKDIYDRNNERYKTRSVHHIRTSTYKDEANGIGYHTEAGRPSKPLGGFFLNVSPLNGLSGMKGVNVLFTMAL